MFLPTQVLKPIFFPYMVVMKLSQYMEILKAVFFETLVYTIETVDCAGHPLPN